MTTDDAKRPLNFVEEIIEQDNQTGKWDGRVHTRFPPEPNGYLHIGHAKSICLNFGLAEQYGGKCNLRFDDTNPIKEEDEYVRSIIEDVKWLGFDWEDRLCFGSDYFEQMHDWAVDLISKGKAYVDDLSAEQIREHRGTLTAPGKNSPYRDRSVEENLNMRDPIIYRILRTHHHRTGDAWCVYPMYDWAHGLEDSIENITHSICTLEFENHRPLYNWFLDQLGVYHPQQIEFARLELTYTMMSKRLLLELVNEGHVSGWDDPRMPTLSGLRRRGYTPESIRAFCKDIGVAKFNSTIDIAKLENAIRTDLNKRAPRKMAVLKPLKVVIDNYPDEQTEQLDAINNPEDTEAGSRKVPFSKVLYIERDDFMEDPPRKFFRLAPGREVRLRYAYFITCTDVLKNDAGEVVELHCTYDPATKGGDSPDGRKVKATLHWVSAAHAIEAEVRIYDHLFTKENPGDVDEGRDYKSNLNPDSLQVLASCKVEPGLKDAPAGSRFQFERQGYFCVDPDSTADKLVFNRTVTLKDTWAKIRKKQGK